MKIGEVIKMLELKKYSIQEYQSTFYAEIFIKRKHRKFNITFTINPLSEKFTCANKVKICKGCHTDCCGRSYQNFIIESKKIFELEVDKMIKWYLN